MQNKLSENERATLLSILNRHLGHNYPVQVILFGSMASGNPRPTSDIDIAIKATAPLDKATWAKIEGDFENSLLSREVDVVDYWRVTPEFRKIIDDSGQIIIASKSHPYRLCPVGHHWVKTHLREVPPSATNPAGGLTEVDGHCRTNSGKGQHSPLEVLTVEEIKEIFKRFSKPNKSSLPIYTEKIMKDWNRFDDKIIFWTEFWNSVYNPKNKLDPILVKALIASESSFILDPDPQNAGSAGRALGLIQLTDEALKILSEENSELTNYLIKLNASDVSDADASIAAGIRWLFHKKKLADAALKRESTWVEAIINYKGYLRDYKNDPKFDMKGLNKFNEELKKLQN